MPTSRTARSSGSAARNITALVLFIVGIGLLAAGVIWGLTDPFGVLIGMSAVSRSPASCSAPKS